LRSMGTGMKRLTRAEQGQTWPMKGLQEARVGRLAESRPEQKEDYGRDGSNSWAGEKNPRLGLLLLLDARSAFTRLLLILWLSLRRRLGWGLWVGRDGGLRGTHTEC